MGKVYDPALVEAVKNATDDGKTPIDILQEGEIEIGSEALMALIRDGTEHGWDNIKAEHGANFLGDDEDDDEDDDEPEEVTLATDDEPTGDTDADDSDASAAQAAGKAAIEEAVAPKTRKRRKAAKKPVRGKKPSNTKSKFKMNRARRKKRGGNPQDYRKRLLMDMEARHPEFIYRWVLDRPGRIRAMQAEDYDIVTDAHVDPEAQGGNVSAVAGSNHYNADNMVLMRKYKKWHVEDQADKDLEAQGFEAAINGQKTGGSSLVDNVGPQELIEQLKNGGVDSTNTYVPVGEKNQVGQVSETLN